MHKIRCTDAYGPGASAGGGEVSGEVVSGEEESDAEAGALSAKSDETLQHKRKLVPARGSAS